MSATSLHEPEGKLRPQTVDMHRAIRSLMEELEAIDWYRQRADASSDDGLKKIMLHNAREEIEHACMVLEWIRRADPEFDAMMREYLFHEGDITEREEHTKLD
ncbi:MAG: ferritin [Deltaproteobacteria bacterium]|nr:ferritin [Deltaproteobacteria bacterium]